MPAKRKTTTTVQHIDTELVPLGDAAPDPYVEDPNYDKANDDVDLSKIGDPHPDMGPKPEAEQ